MSGGFKTSITALSCGSFPQTLSSMVLMRRDCGGSTSFVRWCSHNSGYSTSGSVQRRAGLPWHIQWWRTSRDESQDGSSQFLQNQPRQKSHRHPKPSGRIITEHPFKINAWVCHNTFILQSFKQCSFKGICNYMLLFVSFQIISRKNQTYLVFNTARLCKFFI